MASLGWERFLPLPISLSGMDAVLHAPGSRGPASLLAAFSCGVAKLIVSSCVARFFFRAVLSHSIYGEIQAVPVLVGILHSHLRFFVSSTQSTSGRLCDGSKYVKINLDELFTHPLRLYLSADHARTPFYTYTNVHTSPLTSCRLGNCTCQG